jgi:glycosyltransferase involved in cell wall biosynthesis
VNKGQSAAINLALHASQSDYVAILDSDDLWMPTKIERQVDFLERNPGIGMVYVNGVAIDENGKELWKIYPEDHIERNTPGDVLVNCYFLLPNNALLRRSVLEQAGDFDETLRSAQDHDMAIRVAEVTRLGYFDEVLFQYRKHSDSQSYRFSRRRWENGFIIYEKACRRHPYSWNVRRRRLAVLNFRMGQCCLEEGTYIRSIPYFMKAGFLAPVRSVRVLIGLENTTGLH